MPARSIDTARISFGLVTIPVKLYSTAQHAEELHFHLVHAGCGERLHQQYVCPAHGPVERADMVKGYQLSKTRVVELTKEELKALEATASDDIGLSEFVPTAAVDPLYIDNTYYVAPAAGGERAYRLFRDALEAAGLSGIATYAARGKQYVVMLRPFEDGLVMHQLRYPDEVRPWSDVELPKLPAPPRTELALAGQVIDSLRRDEVDLGRYKDEVKQRVRALVAKKARGGEITMPEAPAPAEPVTDLMAALKASLAGGASGGERGERGERGKRTTARSHGTARRPARKAAAHAPARKAKAAAHRPASGRSTRSGRAATAAKRARARARR